MPKIKITDNFWPKSRYFGNLHQNRDFQRFWKNRYFSKFWSKSRYFEKFYFNQDFSKILTRIEIVGYLDQNRDVLNKIEICRRFWPNFKLSPILTKNAVLWNFQKLWPESRLSDIWTKIEMFRIKSRFIEDFDQTLNSHQFWTKNAVFRKFCPKLRFSHIFTEMEVFGKASPKSRLWKILTKIAIFRKFWPKSGFFESLTKI